MKICLSSIDKDFDFDNFWLGGGTRIFGISVSWFQTISEISADWFEKYEGFEWEILGLLRSGLKVHPFSRSFSLIASASSIFLAFLAKKCLVFSKMLIVLTSSALASFLASILVTNSLRYSVSGISIRSWGLSW